MEGSLRQIALSDLGDTVGTPPSSYLVGSVRRHGVVQPVILMEQVNTEGVASFRIIDGNRRVAAARRSRNSHVPAIVFSDLDPELPSRLTLLLNSFRQSNLLTEFWAIRELERARVSEKEIMSESGLTRAMIQKRTALSKLNRNLFVGLRNGKVYQTYAATIAKLPEESQDELLQTFERKGKLVASDLDPYKLKRPRSTPLAPAGNGWSVSDGADSNRPTAVAQVQTTNLVSIRQTATATPPPMTCESPESKVGSPAAETAQERTPFSMVDSQAQPSDLVSIGEAATQSTPQMLASRESESDAAPTPIPNATERMKATLRNSIRAARVLDFTMDEYLELATDLWRELDGQTSKQ